MQDVATDRPAAEPLPTTVEVSVERMVAGGLGLGHEPAGRAVLVEGALPGERVVAVVTDERPRMLRARTTQVVEAAVGRIAPPCPELLAGCGGCDLQHAGTSLQWALKAGIVADALQRIGRLQGVPILAGRRLGPTDYRTTLRCGVDDRGRPGFRRRHLHELHTVDRCLIAHPLVDEIVRHGHFPDASEVTIRAGVATGERLVLVTPRQGVPAAAAARAAVVAADVRVVEADGRAARDGEGDCPPWIHEVVHEHRFRVSATSFFQARPDGAAALVDAVRRALGPVDPTSARLADLYGGVGLFTGALGARGAVLVERSASSVADARVNLEPLDTRIVRSAVERWRPSEVDAVVADPARAGLGKDGARVVAATGAERVALVSCDPAALARDARLLVDLGYAVDGVELVDLFPQTHHVEAVTTLRRVARTR
ncbi:MAG: class I SAM-dependent RNA methyltransferase [Microthrixaceae bacterium]